jgi:hypothetical protein
VGSFEHSNDPSCLLDWLRDNWFLKRVCAQWGSVSFKQATLRQIYMRFVSLR